MWVLLNRSFYPDTEAAGEVLTALARALASDIPITVVCGFPYDDTPLLFQRFTLRLEQVRIIRVPHTRLPKGWPLARLCNWVTYTASASVVALALRPRGIVVATDPPLLALTALTLQRLLGCRVVVCCQDLYAEAALAMGAANRGIAFRLLDYATRQCIRAADMTVAISNDMAERLAAKGADARKLKIIRNGADTRRIKPVPVTDNPLAAALNPDQRCLLMYAGNIGMAQDWGTLLDALERMRAPVDAWRMVIVGDGVCRSWVAQRASTSPLASNIRLERRYPNHQLQHLLSLGTLHLVPLRRGLVGCVSPSKAYPIMAAGRPFLAISDAECEYARQAHEQGCGLCAQAGDPDAVAERIDWAITHRAELERMGQRSRELAVQHFDVRRNHAQWLQTLIQVTGLQPRRANMS